MKSKIIVCVFLVCGFFHMTAQNNSSLKKVLEKCRMIEEGDFDKDSLLHYSTQAKELSLDTGNEKYKGLSRMYFGASHFRKDSSVFFFEINQSIEVFRSISYYEGLALSYLLLARKYNDLGMYNTSLENFTLAEQALDNENEISSERYHLILCRIAYLRSSVYQSTAEYLKALEVGLKSIEHARLAGDSLVLFKSYNNLSVTYGDLSSPDKNLGTIEDRDGYSKLALKYLTKAYDLSAKMDIPLQKAVSGFNLALLHCNNNDFELSTKLLYDVIPPTYEAKMPDLRYHVYDVLGDIFLESNRLDSAEYYIRKGEQLANSLDAPYYKIDAKYNLSGLYLAKNMLLKSAQYASSGLMMAKKEESLKNQRLGNSLLYEINERQGNFKKALDFYISFKTIEDSMLSERASSEIKALTEKHQSEIKQVQIEQLQQKADIQELQIQRKNLVILSLAVFAVLVSMLIFYFFRNRALNERKNAIHSKQKLLRTQLNPHFIFNALNSIQQYIYQEKNPQLTADYLAKFARLTRRILNYSKEDYILLKDEIAFLEDYIELQLIRFDEPFEYKITVDEDIDESEVFIPPMFTQPFIENSIEHGILDKQEKGRIEIKISKDASHLHIQIEDNGVGREKAEFKKMNKKHRSMATRITMERLREMERLLRKKTKLAIDDIINDDNLVVGTKVRLQIPMKLL
ncbi:MAG: histidine kinase [Saprospiraceae bacterium]|nr:histidine kinase [Saprospiraceae bacterium]